MISNNFKRNIKFLGIHLTKSLENLYTETKKLLEKQIKKSFSYSYTTLNFQSVAFPEDST